METQNACAEKRSDLVLKICSSAYDHPRKRIYTLKMNIRCSYEDKIIRKMATALIYFAKHTVLVVCFIF